MNNNKNRRGFTLVEIMIVVLIIGILMSIAAPSYITARSNSRKAICIGNLKQIDSGKEQYAMDAKLDTGATVLWTDITPAYFKPQPVCPAGGTYNIQPVGTVPTCSVARHVYLP